MSESAVAHGAHGHHAKPSFVSHYLFSLDHKMIARQFLFVGLLMLMIGGILAMLVRWQLAWPETPVPGLGFIAEPYIYPGPNGGGIIPPQTYSVCQGLLRRFSSDERVSSGAWSAWTSC